MINVFWSSLLCCRLWKQWITITVATSLKQMVLATRMKSWRSHLIFSLEESIRQTERYYIMSYTPYANMAEHSLVVRDELHKSEASRALVLCFDNASPKQSFFFDNLLCFISPCLRVFVLLNATRREWNLPQERKFFLVSLFASEGKTDEGKEFTIAEGTVKVCFLHFKLEDLRICVTDRI